MSITSLIRDRVRQGMLFPVLPRAPGTAARRSMFVVEELWQVLDSPEGDIDWERRVAELQADLEVFVEGMPIDPKYLFLLYPAEKAVWEIRSTRPSPSIRVLGLFADLDVFIATNYAFRSDLGGWFSREWRDVKVVARTRWSHLFHTYQPKRATDIKQLVTGALDGRYFRNPPHNL